MVFAPSVDDHVDLVVEQVACDDADGGQYSVLAFAVENLEQGRLYDITASPAELMWQELRPL